jgi:hypothetical protein
MIVRKLIGKRLKEESTTDKLITALGHLRISKTMLSVRKLNRYSTHVTNRIRHIHGDSDSDRGIIKACQK